MGERRVAIVGLFNSGSTAVAGMLYRLGVNLGPPFWGGDSDPGNFYEFLRLGMASPQVVDRTRVDALRHCGIPSEGSERVVRVSRNNEARADWCQASATVTFRRGSHRCLGGRRSVCVGVAAARGLCGGVAATRLVYRHGTVDAEKALGRTERLRVFTFWSGPTRVGASAL